MRISTAGTYIEVIDGSLSNLEKRQYLPNYWSEKVFKGTIAIFAWGVTWNHIKGTVYVSEGNPLFTECYVWFTMIQKSDLSRWMN